MIIGFAYKANTTDFRNTKVIDVYNELKSFGIEVDIYDNLVNEVEVFKEFGVHIVKHFIKSTYNFSINIKSPLILLI